MADGHPAGRSTPAQRQGAATARRATPSPPATSSATCPRTAGLRAEQVRVIEYAAYPTGCRTARRPAASPSRSSRCPPRRSSNQAPVARSFSASVTAGDPLTMTVPTFGVDPDGDSVTVQRHRRCRGRRAVDLTLRPGRRLRRRRRSATRPTRCSAGTEVLHYEVRDRFGATSTGVRARRRRAARRPAAAGGRRRRGARRAGQDASPSTSPQNDLIARGDVVDLESRIAQRRGQAALWRVDDANTTSPPRCHGRPRRASST